MNWLWNRIGFALPDDWEMLQFSRNPEMGRCAFADRYQFRFELNWMRAKSRPDMERMASDYTARLTEEGLEDVRTTRHGHWTGASGIQDGRPVSRYCAFLQECSMVSEAVFICGEGEKASPAFEGRILDSIRGDDSQQGRWKAFGMEWNTDKSLTFSKMSSSYGFAEAEFASRGRGTVQIFSRRGMLASWLGIPVGKWLEGMAPKGYTVRDGGCTCRAGHEMHRMTAEGARRTPADWLKGPMRMEAAAFICPADGRLYFVSSTARAGKSPFPMASLACGCGACATAGDRS